MTLENIAYLISQSDGKGEMQRQVDSFFDQIERIRNDFYWLLDEIPKTEPLALK